MFPLTPWAGPRSSFVQPVEPPSVDPDEGGLITISFNPAWLPYVLGALTQLTQLTTWIGDDDAKRLAVERATGLMNLIGLPAATSVPGEPPSPTIVTRYDTDCACVQTSTDGGVTWDDAPGSDPRTSSPLPPQTGSNADCNSAASERKYLTRFVGVLQITGDTGVTATGLGYAILALLLDLSGPWAIIFEVVVAAALGFISAGLTAINLAFDDGNLDILECDLFCVLNGATALTADTFAQWQTLITSDIGGTDATILNAALTLQGVGGVNSAMALKLDTDDCSGCGCTWCYTFDFTAAQGGWVSFSSGGTGCIYGAWVPGLGWQSIYNCDSGSHNTEIRIFINAPGASVTGCTIVYDAAIAPTEIAAVNFQYDGAGTSGTDQVKIFSGAITAVADQWRVDLYHGGGSNASFVLKSVTFEGTGSNPFGVDNC